MQSIAFHLQKGGVGKTSLSGAVGFELAGKGKTILIDADPQGNLSSWLLSEAPAHELAEVLSGKIEYQEAVVSTLWPNLNILPTFGLGGDLKTYGENQLANEPFIFCDLIEALEEDGYDHAVIDLSPGIGRLERAALLAVNEVITPMTPEYFSLDGIEIFATELQKLKKSMRRGPEFRRVVVNAYDDRIDQHRKIMGEVLKLAGYQIHQIPVDPAFRKAQAQHVPVQLLPRGQGAKAATLQTLTSILEENHHGA